MIFLMLVVLAAEPFDWTNFLNITGPVGAIVVAFALGTIVPGKLYDQQRKDLEKAYEEARTQGVKVVEALAESNRLLADTSGLLRQMHYERQRP